MKKRRVIKRDDYNRKMKTVNRGKLRRLAEQGKLLARCNYCYTDDYIYDNANDFGRTKQYLPVYVIQKGESRWNVPEGYIGIDEYYFRCKGGHAWEEEDGTITLYPYQNLSYSLKISNLENKMKKCIIEEKK